MRLRKLYDWPRLNCVTFRKLGRWGRLGNQLFQIAATVGYAQLHGLRYRFRPWECQPFFHLEGCFTTRLHTWNEYQHLHNLYHPIPAYRSVNLFGYFQSERYFAHCKGLIRELLTPRLLQPTLKSVASIHVRREDYVEKYFQHYEVLEMNYFEKAMERLPVNRYLIFSTDIAWCKEHFIGNQFTIVEGGSQEEDLALMASCEHHVIANSSFSWWGAWLNPNEEKRVIAPNRWFGPKQPGHNLNDLIPAAWIRIDSNPAPATIGA